MEILSQKNLEEYKRFIESNPKGHFMQGPEWGKVKKIGNGRPLLREMPKAKLSVACLC